MPLSPKRLAGAVPPAGGCVQPCLLPLLQRRRCRHGIPRAAKAAAATDSYAAASGVPAAATAISAVPRQGQRYVFLLQGSMLLRYMRYIPLVTAGCRLFGHTVLDHAQFGRERVRLRRWPRPRLLTEPHRRHAILQALRHAARRLPASPSAWRGAGRSEARRKPILFAYLRRCAVVPDGSARSERLAFLHGAEREVHCDHGCSGCHLWCWKGMRWA